MNLKKDIYHLKLDNIGEKQAYLIGNIIFLLGHIIYLVLFHNLGVSPMEKYNYFSMIYYTAMCFLTMKIEKSGILMIVSLIEVVIHSSLCVYYMGWDVGFSQFLIFIIPIPFFPSMKKKFIPFLISAVDLVIYCLLKIGTTNMPVKYSFYESTDNFIFLINSFFGFVIIVYISSVYLFQRESSQRKLEEHNETLRKLATIDPLTKLYNRRAMFEYSKAMIKSSRLKEKGYFIGLADIDDFKKVNDTYGHDIGDKVLKSVAAQLLECVPEEGCVCRWGGEELLFAIPEYAFDNGFKCAEDFRSNVENLKFEYNGTSFSVTITIGVYEGTAGEDFENAVRRADNRLYIGKKLGKNIVIFKDK